MLNNNQIETKSVSYIEDILTNSDYIEPHINTKDKMPSWDGDIILYNKKENRKDSMKGKISTQLKGHCKAIKKNNNSISELIKVSDLKNYYNDGGVMYFVVIIDNADYDNKKAYYKALTPLLIKQYLENKEKETISIKMDLFPKDSKEITSAIFEFYDNCKKQEGHENIGLIKDITQIDELSTLIHWSGDTTDQKTILACLNKKDRAWYGKIKNTNITAPLHYNISSSIIICNQKNVTINQKEYYKSALIQSNEKGCSIIIGQNIKIHLLNDKSLLNFTCSKYVRKRLYDINFLLDAAQTKTITIGETEIDFSLNKKKLTTVYQFKNEIRRCEKIIELLDSFKVSKDLDIENLSRTDDINLKTLIKYYDATQTDLPQDINKYSNTSVSLWRPKISNLCLIFLVIEYDKNIKIINLFNTKLCCCITRQDSTKQIVPIYSLLTKKDYITMDNIDYLDIVKSLIDIENDDNEGYTKKNINFELLKMLLAYDESNKKNLILATKELALWLIKEDKSENIDVNTLNLIQINKRINKKLSPDEKITLYKIIEKNIPQFTFAANLLLDNIEPAKYYFNKLSLSEQENIKTWPIYKFCIE